MWGIALLLPVTSACQPLFRGERLRKKGKERKEMEKDQLIYLCTAGIPKKAFHTISR